MELDLQKRGALSTALAAKPPPRGSVAERAQCGYGSNHDFALTYDVNQSNTGDCQTFLKSNFVLLVSLHRNTVDY